ncbi:MAG: hypothetical protein M3Y56_03425 [Armatimonadota bacterium]|nr:hypothetical protein [Armatimonadota bacterium]
MDTPMFNGGEIVRLKNDYPRRGLQAGDCGVIWGVYNEQVFEDLPAPFYEATFRNQTTGDRDLMFNAPDVEVLSDPDHTPYPEWIRGLQRSYGGRNPM